MGTIHLRILALFLMALLSLGCLRSAREVTRSPGPSTPKDAVTNARAAKDVAQVAPPTTASAESASTILAKAQGYNSKASLAHDSTKGTGRPGDARSGSTHPFALVRTVSGTASTARSEEDHVRDIAIRLAEEHPSVRKIKICFDSKDEEWWIVLYQDAGPYYQLRQFIWSINHDVLEPFLVVERVSTRSLLKHLYAKERNRKCEVLEPPKRGWLAMLTGSHEIGSRTTAAKWTKAREPTRDSIDKASAVRKNPRQRNVVPPRPSRATALERDPLPRMKRVNVPDKARSPLPDTKPKKRAVSKVAARKGKQRQAFRNRSHGTSQQREGDFVSNAFGQLRTRVAESSRPRPRLGMNANGASRSANKDSAGLSAVPLSTKQELKTRRPMDRLKGDDLRRHVANPGTGRSVVSSQPTGNPNALTPTYRAASAGPDGAPEVPPATATRREKTPAVPPRRVSMITVRSDRFEGVGTTSYEKASRNTKGAPTYFVFAYGSKMHHQDLLQWLEANGYDSSMVVDATPAVLDGYDFVWNYYSPTRHGGAVNLAPAENSRIWGLLIEFHDPLLQAFDKREGHPHVYSRGTKRVPVTRAEDGKKVFAWLYLARPNRDGRRDIWPTEKYKQTVIQAARFWGFPSDYVDRIRSWKTQ